MEYKVINEQLGTVNTKSTGFDTDQLPRRATNLGMQVKTTGTNQSIIVKIQHSNVGGTNDADWGDITDATVTATAGTGSFFLTPVVDCGMKYYRAVPDITTNSAGTYTVSFNFN